MLIKRYGNFQVASCYKRHSIIISMWSRPQHYERDVRERERLRAQKRAKSGAKERKLSSCIQDPRREGQRREPEVNIEAITIRKSQHGPSVNTTDRWNTEGGAT